jgi:vacuolar-type H+-ATPase subunit I/STV1
MNLADAEGRTVTTRHVKKAVDAKLNEQRVRDSDYKIVQHMMDSGDVSVTVAAKMVDRLNKLTPQQKAFVFGIMGTHGLTSAPLIPRLARLADRTESKMLPEIQTGYLNGKPLADANLTDWEAAAEEARREHLAEKQAEMEATQQIEARIVTVYRTRSPQADAVATAQRTLTALKRELTDRDIQALKELLTHDEDHRIREAVAAT